MYNAGLAIVACIAVLWIVHLWSELNQAAEMIANLLYFMQPFRKTPENIIIVKITVEDFAFLVCRKDL